MTRHALIRGALFAAALTAAGTVAAGANDICLESKASGERITGSLISFTGRQWDVQTTLGRLKVTIDDFFVCGDAAAPTVTTRDETADAPAPASAEAPSGADAAPDDPSDHVSVVGSNTVGAVLMPRLAAAALSEDGRIDVAAAPVAEETTLVEAGAGRFSIRIVATGTNSGFRALEDGTASLAMASRQIAETEARAIAAAGQGGLRDPSRELVIALDGVVPIVSRDNPLEEVSLHQLTEVFAGRIVTWRELGYADAPIAVLARDANSGTFDTFEALVLAPSGSALAPSARRFVSNADLAAAVAADPNAIGFVAAGALSDPELSGVRPLTLRGECGITQEPSRFNLRTEDYALGRRLYLYSRFADRSGVADTLVEFALSDSAQPIIEEAGFISLAVEDADGAVELRRLLARPAPPEAGADALRDELREVIDTSRRLSVTFRFEFGSTTLDSKARRDGTRLARYLRGEEAAGRQVVLLGFADSVGGFEANRRLSERRAEEAAALLRANGVAPERIETIGFGELLPVFCNDTDTGRAKNRRVEVWVR